MKMDMGGKPDQMHEMTNEGSYSQEQLDEMLETFIEAKKIEGDSKLLAVLKDYAMSKNKMVQDLFDVNKLPSIKGKVKSVDDIRMKSKEMSMMDGESEED